MTTKPIGLYLHVPFCVRKCNYCDFCSFSCDGVDWRADYFRVILDEIRSYYGKNISVDSIFFGGGTPSLLTNEEFCEIVSTIKECFELTDYCEFTVEVNPGTVTKDKISVFIENGVNRISIGLQSIHENELKTLGRIHGLDDFVNSYRLIRDLGITNVNVDIMYGIPLQSMDSFVQTLSFVTELSPEHISVYGLILEEGTRFYDNIDELDLPDEDSECDMYYLASEMLRNHGYSHYEISNYAKDGYECRHNLKYWKCHEYIGFGPSAYSYYDGRRFGNSRNIREYLSKTRYEYNEEQTFENEKYEFVMLGLRLKSGISLLEYEEKFGHKFTEGREDILIRLSETGLVSVSDNKIALTERGFYVSNTILTELL